MRTFAVAVAASAIAAAAYGVGPAPAAPPDPNALWKIVDGMCVPNELQHGNPAPCAIVNLGAGPARGYAVLKDLEGKTQYLLIPTARVTGIESPELLAPDAPNYFADAWRARGLVDEAAHDRLPREDLSLAVNSVHARTQDQLHIHIDCLKAEVRDALQRYLADLGEDWAPFPVPLAGHRYRAVAVMSDDLRGIDPFTLLADRIPGAREAMGDQTLVVAGAVFPDGSPGFVVLTDRFDPARRDNAGGEELQDHNCALARP